MPGCCCCMPLLHINHLMNSCSYVCKNTLLAAKGGCICTPLTPPPPPESATASLPRLLFRTYMQPLARGHVSMGVVDQSSAPCTCDYNVRLPLHRAIVNCPSTSSTVTSTLSTITSTSSTVTSASSTVTSISSHRHRHIARPPGPP